MKNTHKAQTRKYRQLLIVLIVVFCISPFLKAGIGSILSALMLLYTIVWIIRSFALPKISFSVYIAIAFLGFGLQVISSMGWTTSFNSVFALLAQTIFAIYLGVAAYWIARDIINAGTVTVDTVSGGISVYLLIGFVWAFFYGIVATLDVNAFSEELFLQDSYLKVLHFSFTTLTTLGYGDIVPVSEIAQVLANMEAIIGQMYSTVFIAILVGNYLSPNSEK